MVVFTPPLANAGSRTETVHASRQRGLGSSSVTRFRRSADLHRGGVDAVRDAFYSSDVTHPLGGKTSVAIGIMLLLIAVPYASPRLERLRVMRAPWEKATP